MSTPAAEIPLEEAHQAWVRWNFLFPAPVEHTTYRLPRYELCTPDAFSGMRWALWDRHERRTIAFGQTPAEAVDEGMQYAVWDHVPPTPSLSQNIELTEPTR